MSFDTKVPEQLKEIQTWFASIITRPISIDNEMMPISPSGKKMSIEAKKYIVPSPTLKPAARIEIYNQQYWWRLLSAMQENFPLLTRLFGYFEFNQVFAFPYLVKHPPSHWSLSLLGKTLPEWIEENYLEEDKELVLDASLIDCAYLLSFFAAKQESIRFSQENLEALASQTLKLQPHVSLFELNYNLFDFRSKMLDESPEYFVENDFPQLEKGKFYFILYRNREEFVVSDQLSAVAYQMLLRFQEGSSIDALCDWLETQDEKTCDEATSNMQQWFCNWTALQLLTLK